MNDLLNTQHRTIFSKWFAPPVRCPTKLNLSGALLAAIVMSRVDAMFFLAWVREYHSILAWGWGLGMANGADPGTGKPLCSLCSVSDSVSSPL